MENLKDNIIVVIENNWPVSVTEIAGHLGIFKRGMNEKKERLQLERLFIILKN